MKTLLCILSAVTLLCGCSKKEQVTAFEDLSQKEQLENLRSQARQAMLEKATNEVPGIRSIVSADPFTDGDAVVKWQGIVTLDYLNHIGGVDRTNLHLIFSFVGDKVYCLEDSKYYQEQYLARLHRIEAGQEQ